MVAFSRAPHSTRRVATGREGNSSDFWLPSSKKAWVFRVFDLLTERWRSESPWVVRGSITDTSWWMLFLMGWDGLRLGQLWPELPEGQLGVGLPG